MAVPLYSPPVEQYELARIGIFGFSIMIAPKSTFQEPASSNVIRRQSTLTA
ncbi:hypothetical protein FQN51_001902 [Onygenales sp. PD_10]|nr:hypothetical protein FQN51_001902 [Onygenales sp. PD_10]